MSSTSLVVDMTYHTIQYYGKAICTYRIVTDYVLGDVGRSV